MRHKYNKLKTIQNCTPTFKQSDFFGSQIYYRNNISKDVPILFLYALKQFGIFKSINKGPPGLKNPAIIDMSGFGPSNNKTKILLDQN